MMAQKLAGIKGGGGSIRVGSHGKISSLMNRELESSSNSPSSSSGDGAIKLRKPTGESGTKHRSPETTRRARGCATPDRQKQKASAEGEGTSGGGVAGKARICERAHRIPMLGSENVGVDKTPKRDKPARKVSMVEVVDTKCGVPAGSLSSRLKKLGFSKLSQSII